MSTMLHECCLKVIDLGTINPIIAEQNIDADSTRDREGTRLLSDFGMPRLVTEYIE